MSALLLAVAVAVTALGFVSPARSQNAVPSTEPTSPRNTAPKLSASVAVGSPSRGSLRAGVVFPTESGFHQTWDPGRRGSPSDEWRRWGAEWVVAATVCVLAGYRTAHPDRPRVLVGDVSRQGGGPFGNEWGGPGHATHQNGLDIDIYFPRRDKVELPPFALREVDMAASQELVTRFELAGAQLIYVGRRTPLKGTSGVVQRVQKHENHLHVRFPNLSREKWLLTEDCAPITEEQLRQLTAPTSDPVQAPDGDGRLR
jgi:hypothetical protein